jgi:hypothetical protein
MNEFWKATPIKIQINIEGSNGIVYERIQITLFLIKSSNLKCSLNQFFSFIILNLRLIDNYIPNLMELYCRFDILNQLARVF